MDIKAEVKSITKLKDYFFVVPDYQREYVWKPEEQVEQFLTDIDNEYDASAKQQSSYFIGSIIIVKNENKYDVIDGQQRLTTIVLSLCAIRNLLVTRELSGNQKQYLQTVEDLLSNFDIESNEIQLRLELQYEESKGFLSKLIQRESFESDYTPSVKKMVAAYTRIYDHILEYSKNDKGEDDFESLMNFVRYFLTKIELVVIESENLSSALKIFETINQRGAGLNAMDLIKNLLFANANPVDFQKIKLIWKTLMSHLQQCKEDDKPLRFLRYLIMARYYNGILREDEIYTWIISDAGKSSTGYIISPLAFANELEHFAKRYSDLVIATELMKANGPFENVTRIGYINKYRSRQHLILLLALHKNAENDVINYLAQQLESFYFYTNTLKIQAKYNENSFANWMQQFRDCRTIDQVIPVVEKTIIPYIAERFSQFKEVFLNVNHQSFDPLYRLRFILGSIENTILSASGLPTSAVEYNDQMQIEHIFPQTPKNGIIPNEFDDIHQYRNQVYKLGNVTLLEGQINQAVNNFNDLESDWFARKQKEYANSSVISTKLLDDDFSIGINTGLNSFRSKYQFNFSEWNSSSIARRQAILLSLAINTWKFNGVSMQVERLENTTGS